MFAKLPLVLTLLMSLLFVTQAQPMASPVEMKPGGGCAAMQCAKGCCANVACCKITEQQKSPRTPTPAQQLPDAQIAAIDLGLYTLLFIPPARERPFVILDEIGAAHTPPPLAVNCVRLI